MHYERSKDVPPPVRQPLHLGVPRKVGRPAEYPFMDLDVGESVLLPKKRRSLFSSALQYASKKTGWRFVTRKEGDGCRVWRVT